MNLYKLWTNDGGWGGCKSRYVIADNEEQAIMKCQWYQDRISNGCDHFVKEMNGNDILSEFISWEADNYTLEFTIQEK